MAILKCKMCGGDLSFTEGAMTCECEYCGSVNTLPALDNREQRANLYNRANRLRMQCEFDKALTAYEKILDQDNTDAEAHWGAVLSRWGIEYVKDPATGERKPTCHRVQLQSILTDADYRAALEHAPHSSARDTYEAEAKRIAEIQKDILAVSQQEKPYDVFICYKETDENGQRTKDSTLAQDIYYQLTNDGYKVFFSRITLEDKLGQQYEPYIFAALNSARVMLVIGTRPEYFEAIWVKNEWSRYLHLMQSDRNRLLIPCYRDMAPYDLPDELSNLQSQDMGKIGFLQDVLRGVKKVLDAKKEKPVAQQARVAPQQAAVGNATAESLMKRAKLFMEDKDFENANEYLNRVLDINPEYAPAYVGKVQAKLKLRQEEQLGQELQEYENDRDWEKALRFGTPEQAARYQKYLAAAKEARETNRKQGIYDKALKLMNGAAFDSVSDCYEAQRLFHSISGFKDAEAKAQEAETRANELKYDHAAKLMAKATTNQECENVAEIFREIRSFKDAEVMVQRAETRANEFKYDHAVKLLAEAKANQECEKAAEIFREIRSFKDTEEQIKACEQKALEIQQRAYDQALERLNTAKTIEDCRAVEGAFIALSDFHDSKEKAKDARTLENQIRVERKRFQEEVRRRIAAEQKRTQRKKITVISITALVIVVAILFITVVKPAMDYNAAKASLDAGNYDEAYNVFHNIWFYKDADTLAKESLYQKGTALLAEGNYDAAYATFNNSEVWDYRNSATMAKESIYHKGVVLLAAGNYDAAYLTFFTIKGYGDVNTLLMDDENLIAARDKAFSVGNYVTFGNYPQTAVENNNTPIEWQILKRNGSKVLLISRYALDCLQYDNKYNDVTWEICSLRKWLNSDFLNRAFDAEEQKYILMTTVTADKNPKYRTHPGNDTQDKVFLLSSKEAEDLFASDTAMICKPTDYANKKGVWTSSDGACLWWLRSPGGSSRTTLVLYSGGVALDGDVSTINLYAVRPALWVALALGVF